MFMNQMTNLVEFDVGLEADFSSLFHWNTKQLVLFLVVEYSTGKYPRNEITVWDRIVTRKDNKRLSISKLRNKYAINDPHELLQYSCLQIIYSCRGQDVILKLYWNTVPHVGALFDTQSGEASASVPRYATR
jgi:signal peptidase complex subunit 3